MNIKVNNRVRLPEIHSIRNRPASDKWYIFNSMPGMETTTKVLIRDQAWPDMHEVIMIRNWGDQFGREITPTPQ